MLVAVEDVALHAEQKSTVIIGCKHATECLQTSDRSGAVDVWQVQVG
jgi:hypothetical protein